MDRIGMSSVSTATDATILAVVNYDLSIGSGRESAVAANPAAKRFAVCCGELPDGPRSIFGLCLLPYPGWRWAAPADRGSASKVSRHRSP